MKISYNWLQDYINLKNTPPQKVAHTLTMGIVEVEDIIKQGKGLDDKIITGEIINIKKHPNADKLQVVEVNVGKKNLSIVCGAENTKTGQIVPVAQVGAKIYNPQEDKLIKLKKADIRGVKSEGMLLAEDELKLGKDHEGILILDPRVEVGIPLKKALGLDDVVIDIDNKSLTHRADLYCHIGIAREIAALLGKKLKTPKIPKVKEKDKKKLSIEIKDFNLCPRYTGVVLDNIKVKESPLWIQKRLKAVGLQTINSVVDITNYVMLEYGQPMHAFDAEKIISQKIIVRKA
ncbi:phenylalanine--tRNA ligase subunit beta, partial [bacterium (Candidatus Torokbacteria) CG_4_10_14_0_2_um_filter_35_8]